MPLKWKKEFVLGISTVDAQHRDLIDLMGQLHAAIVKNGGRDELKPLFDKMFHYTCEHFTSEESLMLAAGYQGLSEHAAQHAELRRTMSDFRTELDHGGTDTAAALVKFIEVWLENHFLTSDSDMSSHLANFACGDPA